MGVRSEIHKGDGTEVYDFYVVVGKQCRTENSYAGHKHYRLNHRTF